MSSENPYQFSSAEIDPALKNDPDLLEMADLLPRLGAYFLDALFMGVPAGILIFLFMPSTSNAADAETVPLMAAGFWLIVAVIIESSIIASHSATLGKKWLGMKIVRMDGSPVSWSRWFFLRQGVVGLIGAIPFVGSLFTLVNILAIFGAERRCIHDLIADTRVVKA